MSRVIECMEHRCMSPTESQARRKGDQDEGDRGQELGHAQRQCERVQGETRQSRSGADEAMEGHRTGGRPQLDHSQRPRGGDSGIPKPCRFFLKRTCRNGAACLFAHDIRRPAGNDIRRPAGRLEGIPVWKSQHCRYFLQGHCHRGADCSFAHGEAELQYRKSDRGAEGSVCADWAPGAMACADWAEGPAWADWAPGAMPLDPLAAWAPGAMPVDERNIPPKRCTPKLRAPARKLGAEERRQGNWAQMKAPAWELGAEERRR